MKVSGLSDERILYLSRDDVVAAGMSMKAIVDTVEHAFREKGAGRVEMPPKPGIHTMPDAFIHAMPAHLPALGAAGMKWVSGYPGNQRRGLPYINGLIVLNDPSTGIPIMVCDCTWITAMRTAAASAVAARHLARPRPVTLAMLGCGVQGRSHLEALAIVFPSLTRVAAYDTDARILGDYAKWARASFSVEAVEATSARAAVEGADLIITAGPILKKPSPVIAPDWLAPGAFACPIDFDSYFTPAALHRADVFVTDDAAQLSYYREAGYFQDIPAVDGDLGGVVVRGDPRRESDDQIIIAMNLGLALEDMAVAIEIHRRAKALGIGVSLPL
jgi:ornithine cyclodeaminase/alanine dehydrogenase